MICISASTKASKFGLQVSFQSLWGSLVLINRGYWQSILVVVVT